MNKLSKQYTLRTKAPVQEYAQELFEVNFGDLIFQF